MKLDARVSERLEALIQKGEAVLRTATGSRSSNQRTVNGQRYIEWRTQALVCLEQVFGRSHAYGESFAAATQHGMYHYHVERGLGVLRAALEDVQLGYLEAIQQMATAEVFSDFIEQADHLLQNGYHVPAASLAGAVLENGLRSLAEKNDIAVKPRDDLSALNSKLGDKGVYNRLRQKQVAVWVDVRNSADHGRFDELTEDLAADLLKGVQGLLAEHL